MLRFLFSFCTTSDKADKIAQPNENVLKTAFEKAQGLANETGFLRDRLSEV